MKKICGSQARILLVLFMIVAVAPSLHAQTFYNVPALSFTKTFGGANPLPQVVTAASTGAQFNSDATVSTTASANCRFTVTYPSFHASSSRSVMSGAHA